jgi:hypothetical protein
MNLDAGINSTSFDTSGCPGTVPATWTDLTGNGNNGTLMNGTGCSKSTSPTTYNALTFDGANDYVDVGFVDSNYNQVTFNFWVMPTAIENYRNPLTTFYAGNNAAIRFEENASGAFGVAVGNDAGTLGTGGTYLSSGFAANNWYNVVLVWDRSGATITGYLNGVLKFGPTATTNVPTVIKSLAIGTGYDNSNTAGNYRTWKGSISSFQMYKRALSPAEVWQNYTALAGRYFNCTTVKCN